MCMNGKKNLGQYFTVSDHLQQFVFDKVKHKGSLLLEPSFGAGHLLKKFKEANPEYPMECYEVDTSVKPVIEFNTCQTVVYGDFTKQVHTKKFKTIIGNPPYVKQKTGNLYIKFIELCFNLLDTDGELIFIVPSDFIKLTSASSLIEAMVKEGSFTDFLFPHNEKLFEGANVDILIFRYQRTLGQKIPGQKTPGQKTPGQKTPGQKTMVNGKEVFCNVRNGILTFSDTEIKGTPLSDIFDVYVGLVSGKDEVYCNPIGNMNILCDKGKTKKFIFTETFPTEDEAINTHLQANKASLLERKIRKFNEENWFQWGAPRNIKTIEKNLGNPCIFLRNMTRQKEVAFTEKVQHFGGSLLCLIPKKSMAQEDLEKIVSFLNTKDFQKDYMYAGRFKIGHKQVCNSIVP